MAGIYIHIPFCRQKCYYCDFYKTVNTSLIPSFLTAFEKEIELRKSYLDNEKINTIYFGGGTPSVLNLNQLEHIFTVLHQTFEINPDAEITFEANPDDLSKNYLAELKRSGVNRLSIGIQSFYDYQLKRMNRRHNTQQAIECVENAAQAGFENISVDLIYGLPGLTRRQWQNSLNSVFRLPVQHLSAYHLTYHKGTPFYTWLKKGTLKETNEENSVRQFDILINEATKNDFEHYEISNFAKNKLYSQHNKSYWTGEKYLGLGPSAHSFDGNSRQWNVAQTESYINAIGKNISFFEIEKLNTTDKYNEYVITRIRTIWGVDCEVIKEKFGKQYYTHFLKQIDNYKNRFLFTQKQDVYTLTKQGLFISDEIMTNLMFI